MERVLVIGSPGAGKTTLATEIAWRTGLPLIHLDAHYWRPGWVETEEAEWERRVGQLIAGERWVMDGNYGGTLPCRLARADTAIWVDLPAWSCLVGVVRRAIRFHGGTRPDMAEACPERLNWEFFSYTARFRWNGRRRVAAAVAGFGGTLFHLRSRRDVRAFLAGLA